MCYRNIFLRLCPIHRMIGLGVDLQCGALGCDGLCEEISAVCPGGADALVFQSIAKVVLRHGLLHRMIGLGADLQCGAVGCYGLGEETSAVCTGVAGAFLLQRNSQHIFPCRP